jgi:hypothetical protein
VERALRRRDSKDDREIEKGELGWNFTDSLAEDRKADGGNAELRGEVALLSRPRHGGK